eukprot:COSAG02_NODE_7256_length_3094_cov_19.263773_5_plen_82_part_00
MTDGQAIVDAALAAYGRLDVVINNAGILTPETWNDLSLESWQRTLDINLTGVFSVGHTPALWIAASHRASSNSVYAVCMHR